MLKKLALDQTKLYEKHLALEEISIMLVNFTKGYSHHLAIGAEQGNIDKWDDLVIQSCNGGYIYIQAKRQATDFSSDPIIRNTYNQGQRQGELKDLSTLDETFKSLSERLTSDPYLNDKFWLELPESTVQIKDALEIRHLRNLKDQIKDVTTPNDLANLQSRDRNIQNVYNWLTTWCGFQNWEHILKAFQLLTLKVPGYETDINIRVRRNLGQIFIESEIENIRLLIFSYLDVNSTYAGAIKPRQLLYMLNNYLLTNIDRWSLFYTDGLTWKISGIHDLEDNSQIERPNVIIPAFWSSENFFVRSLKIYGQCIGDCHVSKSIIRLSLHPQGSFNVYFSNKNSWENMLKNLTGGTLGVAENDLSDLRMLNCAEQPLESDFKQYISSDEKEDFAKNLNSEMYKITFDLVDRKLMQKISSLERSILRNELEIRWSTWKQALDIERQRTLFSKILHPKVEGRSISGELRVGPKSADLICEAIYLLLIVSVCLGDENNLYWESVSHELSMQSIGLAYWSGPADSSRKVVKIDSDPYLCKILENEREQIVIIPQSDLTDIEIFEDDIAGDINKLSLLTHPKYPKLLITQDRNFKRILMQCDILKLKEYFKNSIDKYNCIVESAINNIVNEVII